MSALAIHHLALAATYAVGIVFGISLHSRARFARVLSVAMIVAGMVSVGIASGVARTAFEAATPAEAAE